MDIIISNLGTRFLEIFLSFLPYRQIHFLINSLCWYVDCFLVHFYTEGAAFQDPGFIQGFYFELSGDKGLAHFLSLVGIKAIWLQPLKKTKHQLRLI